MGSRIAASTRAGSDSFNSIVVRYCGYRYTGVTVLADAEPAETMDDADADERAEEDEAAAIEAVPAEAAVEAEADKIAEEAGEVEDAEADEAATVAPRTYSEHMSATVVRSLDERDSHFEMI